MNHEAVCASCGCAPLLIDSYLPTGGNPGGLQVAPKQELCMSNVKPLIVGWKDLRKMGWCYSRAHTWRLMFDSDYAVDAFPACRKLNNHRHSHPVWRVSDVLAYFEAHGLAVTQDWLTP